MGWRAVAHQSPAALSAPQIFVHRGDHLPDAAVRSSLNPAESAREREQSDARTRRVYRLTRLLWRTGAMHYCAAQGLCPSDPATLPASGIPEIPGQGFHSSLTHSHDLQIAAFHSQAIGVDAEPVGRKVPWQRLAARWFTRAENHWLRNTDNPLDHFLLLWTLKEAWIKATRRGIASNLQALSLASGATVPTFRVDRPETDWYAATTLADGFRISVIRRGASLPLWFDVATPGTDEIGRAHPEWTQYPLEPDRTHG